MHKLLAISDYMFTRKKSSTSAAPVAAYSSGPSKVKEHATFSHFPSQAAGSASVPVTEKENLSSSRISNYSDDDSSVISDLTEVKERPSSITLVKFSV